MYKRQDVNNINWSQKKSNDDKKPKKKKIIKKSQIPPGTNIVYKKIEDEKIVSKKIVKITNEQNSEKPKEATGKRFENKASSLGQVKERSYKRPGR